MLWLKLELIPCSHDTSCKLQPQLGQKSSLVCSSAGPVSTLIYHYCAWANRSFLMSTRLNYHQRAHRLTGLKKHLRKKGLSVKQETLLNALFHFALICLISNESCWKHDTTRICVCVQFISSGVWNIRFHKSQEFYVILQFFGHGGTK